MMATFGITIHLPSNMIAAKKWIRLAKRSKIQFKLPDPIGGEWFVQSIASQDNGDLTIFSRTTTIVLIPVIRTKKAKNK